MSFDGSSLASKIRWKEDSTTESSETFVYGSEPGRTDSAGVSSSMIGDSFRWGISATSSASLLTIVTGLISKKN